MINIPLQDIKKKIQDQAGISLQDIDSRVAEKMKQLSGLISEEGACHIIANELSVKLIPEVADRKVKDLMPGMRDVQQNLKVIQAYDLKTFQAKNGGTGKVLSMLAGDESGVIRVTSWGDKADEASKAKVGDVIRIKSGYIKENNGKSELHLNDKSEITLNPTGITVEVKNSAEEGYERKKISDLSNGDYKVEILGTLVQVYDPRFFAKKDGSGEGIVANVLIDDGSGNVRCACWGDKAAKLLGMTEETVLSNKDGSFEEAKQEALGAIVKIQGRAKLNTVYNNIEVNVDDIDLNPDAAKELGTAPETKETPKEEIPKEELVVEKKEETVSLDDLEDLEDPDLDNI